MNTLQIATQLQDQSRRLAATRENAGRTYKSLEKVVERLKWTATMENYFANDPEGKKKEDQAQFLMSIAQDKDKVLQRVTEILGELGITYRALIGVSNALTTAGKELLVIAQPELRAAVQAEMQNQKLTTSGLSPDATKADPYQAQDNEDKAEAREALSEAISHPNLAGPTL